MEQLKQAIENDNLIIFVGSGLSKQFDLPDWNKMVIDIIRKINKKDLNLFIPILETGTTLSAIDVLDFLKNDKKEVYKYIAEKFRLRGDEDFNIHNKILKLSKKIITTNFDNAFELASKNLIIPSKPTSKYTINEINRNEEPFIFKLHGSFEEPDNCIIFREDYQKLYFGSNEAAPEKLKNLFSEKTFLFIGFSFSDKEINTIFDGLNNVFGGLNRHFIITPEKDKFSNYNFLSTINIVDYSCLEDKIDELLLLKTKNIESETQKKVIINNEILKIAVLYPDNLDQNYLNDYINATNQFNEINAELYVGNLNLKTLNSVDDFDLLIIISNVYKGKIYIEENNLKSNLITIADICENLANPNIPILMLTNEEVNIDIDYSIINIYKYKNQTIKRFLHKLIKDKIFTYNEISIKSNKNIFSLKIDRGKAVKKNFYGNNRNLEIGKKSLFGVIGRKEEQSNLVSRLLIINNSNRILNIKASGGLGKTTLIKKIAYELYNRGYYSKGVNFKSCENVYNFEDFEELLIDGFNLKGILNFREYLIENFSNEKIDLLLILDNFETVVNNLSKEDYSNVIDLLEFASDFLNIVITSRERICNKDFEDIFNLTHMTTDDALELFKINYTRKKTFNNDELKILREEILEDLLANNPLAIKLVTSSMPVMRFDELRDQIKNHFFESINDEYTEVFKNNADLNIERTKSIFQSINYSYSTLNSKQKLAFELLSLFPDGIDLSDFKKCFQKNINTNKITDNEIKQLENKSLLENYNGVLQLQPIIRRFSDFQFSKDKNKQKYCTYAYDYNSYLLKFIELISKKKGINQSIYIFSKFKNNLLKVIDYIPDIEISDNGIIDKKEYLLNYIYILEDFLTNSKDVINFQNKIYDLISFFDDVEHSGNLIQALSLKLDYYHNEFDNSYFELNKMLSVEDMKNRNLKQEHSIESKWKNVVSFIHSMEGYSLDYIDIYVKAKVFDKNFFTDYFYLGLNNLKFIKKEIGFYYFENLYRINKLDVDELKEYIDNLYMEQHLEIMQCTYLLSKVKKISLKDIKKLVITNPYTNGLKNLMFAFNCDSNDEKINYFKKAIKDLSHIKYYYLESIYYYAKFLKEINSDEYEKQLKIGIEMSKKCRYQFLDFLFTQLKNDSNDLYKFTFDYYKIVGFQEYIEKDMEEWLSIEI